MIILLVMDIETILKEIYDNPVRSAVERNIKTIFEKLDIIKKSLLYTLCLDKELEPTFEYNKRMRPFLIWLWSKAALLEQSDIFWKLATVVELIHQSTLPADDIQDNSEIRCWRQALWKRFWNNTTIDIILLLAASGPTYYSKILREDKDWRLHNYSDFLQKTLINLVRWQELDLSANDSKRSIDDYFEIVDWKTWALINLSLHFWTMPYEYLYNQEKSEELSKFSMLFARLYQIMDDIKDIKDIDNRVKWVKLDPSNIYYYVDQNSEKLNDLYWILRNKLFETHNNLKELWVVKNDEILEVIKNILPNKIKI